MSTAQITDRYARAIFEAAVEAKAQPAAIAKQLRTFAEILASSQDLQTVLADSSLTIESKKAIIETILTKTRCLVVTRHMVFVVLERGRIGLLAPILDNLDVLIAAHESRVIAKVESAIALAPIDAKRIQTSLERLTGKKVDIETEIRADLLGGVIIRFGNTVLDGSLQTQLANLGEQLRTH